MNDRLCLWTVLSCALTLGLWAFAVNAAEEPVEPAAAEQTAETAEVANGEDDAHAAEAGHATPDVAVWWIIPFALLLGCIAVIPAVNFHFWEHYYGWFAIILGAITAIYYLFIFDDPGAASAWTHEMKEYGSFIALLGSLYIVSGGIVIHVSRKATALTNTTLLLVGAIIANIVGTTGAAMLLIRPFIRINRAHLKPYHIVFFIFIVANCGGMLTPIGDPPLFMGYLKGVPFFWVLEACWPMWAMCIPLLLIVFFIMDSRDHRASPRAEHEHDAGRAVEIFGFQNFMFIGLILVAVFQPSMFELMANGAWLRLPISREILMLIAAVASKLSTKAYVYERNEFTYGPIREVAILFLGIFSTMVPALNYLNHHADEMPLDTPGQYYFLTGTLSAFLDNAPTYLVFLETKQGQVQGAYGQYITHLRKHLDEHPPGQIPGPPKRISDEGHTIGAYESLVKFNPDKVKRGTVTDADIRIAMLISNKDMALYLIAISVGSVFFGACTYIGNGPNFMVKSIAESAGVKMPTFFGYIIRYSLPILVPIYIMIWLVFFVLLPPM